MIKNWHFKPPDYGRLHRIIYSLKLKFMKKIFIILLIVIFVVIAVLFVTHYNQFFNHKTSLQIAASSQFSLSKKQENVVLHYINLAQILLKNPTIVDAILKQNIHDQHLTKSEIVTLDEQWKSASSNSPFINQIADNTCSKILQSFQNRYPEFYEIFITDSVGLNVCQTNKTSDYYQADESWWQKAYNNGTGKVLYDSIEYDDSSSKVSIPLYLPIHDPQTNQVIGIAKFLLSTDVLYSK